MLSRLVAIASGSVALWCSTVQATSDNDPCGAAKHLTINTSSGPITGHVAPDSKCVVEYLGVPYAEPPTGQLRFSPPERFHGTSPVNATTYGFDCPLTPSKKVDYPDMMPQALRVIAAFASGAGTPQSEDCLTLNIWHRPSTDSTSLKPVIVFFYGGREQVLSKGGRMALLTAS